VVLQHEKTWRVKASKTLQAYPPEGEVVVVEALQEIGSIATIVFVAISVKSWQ
jgi:hypothetical protein